MINLTFCSGIVVRPSEHGNGMRQAANIDEGETQCEKQCTKDEDEYNERHSNAGHHPKDNSRHEANDHANLIVDRCLHGVDIAARDDSKN